MIALALLVGTGGSTALRAEQDRAKDDTNTIVFTIDVAEDFTLFSPTFVRPEHTQPERGSFFVTEGNIFPGGTIQGLRRRDEAGDARLQRHGRSEPARDVRAQEGGPVSMPARLMPAALLTIVVVAFPVNAATAHPGQLR